MFLAVAGRSFRSRWQVADLSNFQRSSCVSHRIHVAGIIYLHEWLIFMVHVPTLGWFLIVNVGKYTSPMDPMVVCCFSVPRPYFFLTMGHFWGGHLMAQTVSTSWTQNLSGRWRAGESLQPSPMKGKWSSSKPPGNYVPNVNLQGCILTNIRSVGKNDDILQFRSVGRFLTGWSLTFIYFASCLRET